MADCGASTGIEDSEMKSPLALIAYFGGGSFLLAVVAMAAKFWIATEVSSQLEAAGIVKSSEVTALRSDVDENAEDIGNLTDRWNRLVDALAQK